MGNLLATCLSKQAEKDTIGLMQTLLNDMEKRIMECIKAELTTVSRGSNGRTSGSNTPPPPLEVPKLIRQSGMYIAD